MGDTEDDARYPPNPYGGNHHQGYGSSHRRKLSVQGGSYSRPVGGQYVDVDEDDEEVDEDDEELGEEEDDHNHGQNNGYPPVVRKNVGGHDEDDDEDEDEDDDNDDDGDEDEDENEEVEDEYHDHKRKDYGRKSEDVDLQRHPKKRKLKSLVSSYEFAPRVPPAPSAATPSAPRLSFGGRNSLTDWTERETFVLLEAWGERFLQRGKKSLRSEEWQEVAEKVSEVSKIERTDTQCRNRLDTLKKKYKKEKLNSTVGGTSKWVFFKKMDLLLSSPNQQSGLSCGLDSGEYVFMNPRVYLNSANGLDEMRDSPVNTESEGGDDSDGLPPKKRKSGRDNDYDDDEGSSFRLLADTIQKFGEIYEKIEDSKRQQMVELEKMRMDFHRDLELQRRQIMERAQAEIAKIQQGDDEEIDVSAENGSG